MRIPIQEAILAGDWLIIDIPDENYKYKIRLLEFKKICLKDIDNKNSLSFLTDAGSLWILTLDLLNIGKIQLPSVAPQSCLILYDQDDCEFETVKEMSLTYSSDLGRESGLRRFVSNESPFPPKIKGKGAVAFFLPDDEEAEYFISTRIGTIQGI